MVGIGMVTMAKTVGESKGGNVVDSPAQIQDNTVIKSVT